MPTVNSFAASMTRLQANRDFVSHLLVRVPALQNHAIVTDAIGKDTSRMPEESARLLVDSALLTDGISQRSKRRIIGLIQALPGEYAKLGPGTQREVDNLLATFRNRLRHKARGGCCFLHRRTLAVSETIMQIDRLLHKAERSAKSHVSCNPSESRSKPPVNLPLKPISFAPNEEGQLEWEEVDKPVLKAPPPSPGASDKLEPPLGEGVINLVPPPPGERRRRIDKLEQGLRQLTEELDIVNRQIEESGWAIQLDILKERRKYLNADGIWKVDQQIQALEKEIRPYWDLSENLQISIRAMQDQIVEVTNLPNGHLFTPEEVLLLKGRPMMRAIPNNIPPGSGPSAPRRHARTG